MSSPAGDLQALRERVPRDDVLTVFDAETQDTSYGILVIERMPLIFDTHRKEGMHVSTVELLTEVLNPIRISSERVRGFARLCARRGLLAIPYSACFFKGNLHVYAFHGAVRGFDVATIGPSVAEAERNLETRVRSVWPRIPRPILRGQADLLAGRRRARYDADLDVLRKRLRTIRSSARA